jgi:hypothetical protein
MTKTQSELTAGEREYLEHLRRSQERKSTPEYQASVNSNSIVMPNSPKTRLTSGTRLKPLNSPIERARVFHTQYTVSETFAYGSNRRWISRAFAGGSAPERRRSHAITSLPSRSRAAQRARRKGGGKAL